MELTHLAVGATVGAALLTLDLVLPLDVDEAVT